MKIPTIIAETIVRKNGTDEVVGLATVTLPDIEHKTEEIQGMGVDTFEQVIPGSFNALSLTMKFTGISKSFNFDSYKVLDLIITAAVSVKDTETQEDEFIKVVCSVKGKIKKRTGGEFGKGNKNEPEIEIALTYYKLEVDGDIIYEIDKTAKKVVIDGDDVYAGIKNILG